MTNEEIIKYYADLLIIQYLGKSKAYAHAETLADMAVMGQVPVDVANAYDINTAEGVQLDVIGKYIGLSRHGFDFDGPITLDDVNYRQALRIKILQNNYGSSLADIQDFLFRFFNGQMFVFDYLLMRIGYFINADFGDLTLVEFFIRGNLLPKPMGVQLSATIYNPTNEDYYGWRTYAHEAVNSSPMNDYDDYQMDYPWLDYNNAVIG
jgi:hypothetical protein